MAKTRDKPSAARWVHVFEEDTPEGAVFRPEGDAIPLSRRPRERLVFHPDGKGHVLVQGADDRYVEQPATWDDEAGKRVLRTDDGKVTVRIIERSPTRLVARIERRS